MAVDYTKQYRPVSTLETAQGDALSIRAIRDIADGINNYKACVGNHPIISEMFVDNSNRVMESQAYQEFGGSNGSLGDYPTVIAVWGQRYIPHGYTRFTVQCCGNVPSGNAGTARFWLYIFNKKYKNPGKGLFSPTGYKYAYATWDFDGGSSDYQFRLVNSSHLSFSGQWVYPVLIADHEPSSGNMPRGSIKSLVVRPMVYERI